MAEKFLKIGSGAYQEQEAIQSSSGVADAGKIPALDSEGRISTSMMPVGIFPDTRSIVIGEALSANDLVNVYDDAGTPKVRKADAANGRRATGFVLTGGLVGATAVVYFEGSLSGGTSLTIGAPVFLSASTAGRFTSTAPSGSGQLVQEVGVAISATEISFEPQRPVVLA